MNRVILIGRLARDPELRQTAGGVAVCGITVAVDRRQKKGAEKQADFVPVVVWREQGEACAKYLRKGSQVGVSGQLQVRSYDAQDGSKRYVTEVIADEVQFLSPSGASGRGETDPSVAAAAAAQAAGLPVEIVPGSVDDDLPF